MSLQEIGWREWIALPDIGLGKIKAKVDTGARTSSLHAFSISPYEENGISMIRFGVHPLQRRDDLEVFCHAAVKEQREVSDSGGHREFRYVIETSLHFLNQVWPIEITLTNRDNMRFRFLLGRTGIPKGVAVSPGKSYLAGRRHRERVYPGETIRKKEFPQ